jgi:hypothetical protein
MGYVRLGLTRLGTTDPNTIGNQHFLVFPSLPIMTIYKPAEQDNKFRVKEQILSI